MNLMTMGCHSMNESQLVYSIMQELGRHGAVYRCNSGSIRLPNGKRFSAMPQGFADVMLIKTNGQTCFVEVKLPGNKPTEAQLRFLQKMRDHHCRADVAYSVEQALQICGIGASGEEAVS